MFSLTDAPLASCDHTKIQLQRHRQSSAPCPLLFHLGWLGWFQLRASNEHSFLVRVPRAKGSSPLPRQLRMRHSPIVPGTQIHFQRHRQPQLLSRRFHLCLHELLRLFQILLRNFEDKLVVNLENHLGMRQLMVQPLIHIDHRHLNEIRR